MDKVKTTLLIDKTLKKLAQVYAIQKETTLQAVVEEALRRMLVGEPEKESSENADMEQSETSEISEPQIDQDDTSREEYNVGA